MIHTTYVNASGLPDDDQITTARDQAMLGRAIQERFPRYYKYFSTQAFVYKGQAIRNHNHLLGSVEGVDGIKTGFTRASGFNLVTSVHRGGRHLVAVVLGGRSAAQRDAHMRELINANIRLASLQHSGGPIVAEKPRRARRRRPGRIASRSPTARVRCAPTAPTATVPSASCREDPGSTDPIRPLLVKTIPSEPRRANRLARSDAGAYRRSGSAAASAAVSEPAPRAEPAPAPAPLVLHAPTTVSPQPEPVASRSAVRPKSEPPTHAHALAAG